MSTKLGHSRHALPLSVSLGEMWLSPRALAVLSAVDRGRSEIDHHRAARDPSMLRLDESTALGDGARPEELAKFEARTPTQSGPVIAGSTLPKPLFAHGMRAQRSCTLRIYNESCVELENLTFVPHPFPSPGSDSPKTLHRASTDGTILCSLMCCYIKFRLSLPPRLLHRLESHHASNRFDASSRQLHTAGRLAYARCSSSSSFSAHSSNDAPHKGAYAESHRDSGNRGPRASGQRLSPSHVQPL
ncbi:hypothetical protein B0T25DRAFT_59329 [Lasiosphaeria hispida]|uniref:Uncharacterized protein n=1 Tax=Lasiosphaeria hispida TaxID=260671 RepID=A0AAJ0ML23_9PEZI|nr:hypothetical protein B0T25DRAFT_59329 [Lasiosphaeria hispida]